MSSSKSDLLSLSFQRASDKEEKRRPEGREGNGAYPDQKDVGLSGHSAPGKSKLMLSRMILLLQVNTAVATETFVAAAYGRVTSVFTPSSRFLH